MSTTAKEKLSKDLTIASLMAERLRAYLSGQVLLPMPLPEAPQVSLAGLLMRLHRLVALRDHLLDAEAQADLDQVIRQVEQIMGEKPAQLSQVIDQEQKARLRQWREYLRDLEEGAGNAVYYHTAVETRAMLEVLLDKAPQAEIVRQLTTLDQTLRQRWQPGPFIWPADWRPAYPEESYWWLYGEPEGAVR